MLGLFFLSSVPLRSANPDEMKLLHSDDFSGDLSRWVVEQQPSGEVKLEDGRMVIADEGGGTVWFRERLEAPVVITYTVKASSEARVSDINCFWMAAEPEHPKDLFAEGHGRTGAFATYDGMETYYVGYGGNYNGTTRFRRYTGDGKRPLLPEHDLSAGRFMIEPDHRYEIRLVAANGRAQFYRDGELIFDYTDDEPLEAGWFGIRTVLSRLIVDDLKVWKPSEDAIGQILEGKWR